MRPEETPDALDFTTGATGAASSPRYAPAIIQPRLFLGSSRSVIRDERGKWSLAGRPHRQHSETIGQAE